MKEMSNDRVVYIKQTMLLLRDIKFVCFFFLVSCVSKETVLFVAVSIQGRLLLFVVFFNQFGQFLFEGGFYCFFFFFLSNQFVQFLFEGGFYCVFILSICSDSI